MLQLTIADIQYTAFAEWAEMPLSKAIELACLCHAEMPVGLKELYEQYTKGDKDNKDIDNVLNKATDEDYIKNFPAFYGSVLQCLSNVPEEIIKKVTPGHRVEFYNKHLFKFVFGVLHFPIDIQHMNIEKFIHKKITYYLPKSKTVLGEIRPFADRPAIEFAESADLELFSKELAGGKWERAANIISIMCRPLVPRTKEEMLNSRLTQMKYHKALKGELEKIKKEDYWKLEPYNEDVCLKRAEQFLDLPMNIVWDVFFCLTQQCVLLKQNTLLSSLKETQNQLKQESAVA